MSDLPPLTLPEEYRHVGQRLAEVVSAFPDHVALESPGQQLTYTDLDRRIRQLAAQLAPLLAETSGEGLPGARRPVAVYADQTADSVAAFLAVVATGHPCVVLDVLLPEGRVGQIAERAGVRVVLADEDRTAAAGQIPGVEAVRGLLPVAGDSAEAPTPPEITLDDPAALVYTSGTTGMPKGVVYTHRTALAIGVTMPAAIHLRPTDRVSLILPYSFAVGQLLVFGPLLTGATVCIRDPRVHGLADLVEWLETSQVTTLHCTPSLLRSIHEALPEGRVLDSVRFVTTAGEKVYGADVLAFRARLRDDAVFANWMGSSETEALTVFEIGAGDPVPDGVVPAGRPVPLREFAILDADGRPVAPGEAGVLHVDSAYMSGGYWEDPEETASRFTQLPDGRTRFRTGDRARLDEAGALHLLGRVDDAAKIRGYLVEPSEVETALRSLSDVSDACVRARTEEGRTESRLVAWVVPDPGQRTPSPAALRQQVAGLLPDWMVPRDVVLLSALPRTERGKVDVGALPDPPPRPEPSPPTTPTESVVEAIWAAVLRLDHVGREESFTALGGDSLAVEEMLARVQSQLDVGLTSADLAEHASLAEFAARVDAAGQGEEAERVDTLVRLRTTGSRTPLFCFAGAGADAAYFEPLAAAVGPDQPVYAFQAHGFDRRGVPDWTVRRAARRYVRVIGQVQPDGPLLLVGHSMGGLVALEAAHLLQAQGRTVSLLTLIDTYLPPAAQGPGPRRGRTQGAAGPRLSGWARWRVRLQVLGAGLVQYPPELRKDVFHAHGARVANFHRPRPWPGRALLFVSNQNSDDLVWWEPLLTGEHAVHQLDGDHHALLKQPHVREVVDRLAEAIDGPRSAS